MKMAVTLHTAQHQGRRLFFNTLARLRLRDSPLEDLRAGQQWKISDLPSLTCDGHVLRYSEAELETLRDRRLQIVIVIELARKGDASKL